MESLVGRIAVITGASSGIGAAIAQELAAAGCHVVLAARRIDKLEEVAAAIRDAHPVDVLIVPLDVTQDADLTQVVAMTSARFGRIDIWVNNAGLGQYGPVAALDMNEMRYLFEVNLFAVVRAIQHVTPVMRAQGGGVIVNVGSIMGKFTMPQLGIAGSSGAYAASKFALQAISATARMELAGDKIHVLSVLPGRTTSEFDQHFLRGPAAGRAPRKSLRGAAPASRVARRTVRAIARREREIYISWVDRAVVLCITHAPWLYEWAMAKAMHMAPSPPANPGSEQSDDDQVRTAGAKRSQAQAIGDRGLSSADPSTGMKIGVVALGAMALGLILKVNRRQRAAHRPD
ncbi:MAG: SDR family NAD(P)-dependent oxidoreductase [Caldilineaceae bacterium]|nr:SDR family NAD(P)-dependent oxidoreductase [Caldilineaceae bacterium]